MSLLHSTIARMAFERGIANLENSGTVGLVIIAGLDGEVADINVKPDITRLLNDGEKKDILFRGVRDAVKHSGVTSIAICTESWMSISTPKGFALGAEMFRKLFNLNGSEWMSENGYLQRFEVVNLVVQTPELASMGSTPFTRLEDGKIEYQPVVGQFDGKQDELDGRLKMFGKEPDQSVWHRANK